MHEFPPRSLRLTQLQKTFKIHLSNLEKGRLYLLHSWEKAYLALAIETPHATQNIAVLSVLLESLQSVQSEPFHG